MSLACKYALVYCIPRAENVSVERLSVARTTSVHLPVGATDHPAYDAVNVTTVLTADLLTVT